MCHMAWPHSFSRAAKSRDARYRLSLGQWTFNRAFRGVEGVTQRSPLEFPTMAGELGFEGVDYSGILLGEHHSNAQSLAELNKRAADAGVKNVLILIDLTMLSVQSPLRIGVRMSKNTNLGFKLPPRWVASAYESIQSAMHHYQPTSKHNYWRTAYAAFKD